MTSRDLIESLAYLEQRPELAARLDVGLAQVQQVIALAAGNRRARLRDFLPSWWGEARVLRQSPEEISARIEAFFARRKPRTPRDDDR